MKVLWVEDQEPVREMLAIAADKAARARVQVDLVLAATLMDAEMRLRLERFDLILLDLVLPDSFDPDMTLARIANMGEHRIAALAETPAGEAALSAAHACGANVAPEPLRAGGLPLNRFIQRPDAFEAFLLGLMPGAEDAAAA